MKNQSNKNQKLISDDEIDIKGFLSLCLEQKFTIALSSIIFFVIFCIYGLLQKKVWEGKFAIVVEQPEKRPLVADILGGNNPNQYFLNSLGLFGGSSSLDTEVEILKSPSVLLPIYDYVINERRKTNKDYIAIPFEKWEKNNLKIELKPRTSVLDIAYRDTNKEIILPVLSKVSIAYQMYSGKRVKRKIVLTKEYLSSQISKYKLQSGESLKKAQEFALDEDLTLFELNTGDYGDISYGKTNNENKANTFLSNLNFEQIRINQLVKIKNIDKQIEQIKALDDDYEQVQFIANNLTGLVPSIINDLNIIETKLIEARSKYTEKDRTIKRLLDKRQILLKLLKERSIANLNALRIIEKAKMESVSRPKNIILKYKELVRTASRDEGTLIALENQLRILNLEEAKYKDPWELITKPTLKKSAVAPRRKLIGMIGFILGIFSGIIFSVIKKDRLILDK